MSKATQKSPAINHFLSTILGKNRVLTIANDLCMSCGLGAKNFRDELSEREYTISGLCQVCQDQIYFTDDMEV
jgi:hypothetical protein